MMYHGFFVLLQWIEVTLSKAYWKKNKRYAYLVLENVGNFQIRIQGWHSGSHAIAWAAIVTSVSEVSYDLQVRVWHCGSRFFIDARFTYGRKTIYKRDLST